MMGPDRLDPWQGKGAAMRRGVIVFGILALFLTAPVLASMAEARAGGGFSGGSRGSRSYSAPRSPSAPARPSAPAPAAPAPAQRPGGFLGGLGGVLGGLLVGGLLGSLLFGSGLGGGLGFGLLEIVLVGVLVYMAFAFFRRRTPEPAMAGVPGRASWTPAEPAAASTRSAAAGTSAGILDQDLDGGVEAIRTMDRSFDPDRFLELVRSGFLRVQAAWSAGDLGPVRGEITDDLAASLESQLARLRTLKRVNRLEQVAVESAEITEAWQEYGRDFLTVRVRATALDYTLDQQTGVVVDGNRSTPTTFEEYWTFVRPVGPQPWRLSAIQQPS
jgi:predicted lipid-binding transport protein (Tim44 family)